MNDDSLLCFASVMGASHNKNEDVLFSFVGQNIDLYLVMDGCSASPYARMSAEFFAPIFASSFDSLLNVSEPDMNVVLDKAFKTALSKMAEMLSILTDSLGQNFRSIVSDFGLFTVVGMFVLRDGRTGTFCVGDGFTVHNSNITEYEAPVEGRPAFPGYTLHSDLVLNYRLEMYSSSSMLAIATDGVGDIPDLAAFFATEFKGSGHLARTLRKLKYVLPDDTTVMIYYKPVKLDFVPSVEGSVDHLPAIIDANAQEVGPTT